VGERRPFVIAGAGIGGLTTAVALAAKGFRAVVVERATELSEIGAGIQLAPNAGRVLAALGLENAIAAAAIEPAAIDVVAGRTARVLTSIPSAAFRERYGFPYRVIHRADLQRILLAATDRIRIRKEMGATVESTAGQSGSLLVRIRKPTGAEVVPAEAVIAADGVWSSHRGSISGVAATATGRTAWRAIVPADVARDLVPIDRVGLWIGPAAHLVHYPVAQGAAVNLVAIMGETWGGKGWTAPGDPAELLPGFSRWSGRARAILAAPVAWQKFAIVTVDPAAPWLGERTVLLGDAAHAMLPFLAQGAAMAIEDAAVLADALAADRDTPAALRAYVAERRPRVTAIAAASERQGRLFHLRGVAAAARNLVLGIAGERAVLGRADPIYRWQLAERHTVSA
jgi:salicylate hydroxylase